MPTRRSPLYGAALLTVLLVTAPNSLSAQSLWGPQVPVGWASLSIGGWFESADQRLGDGGGPTRLVGDWIRGDAADVFPGVPDLTSAVRSLSGDAAWSGVAGELRGEAQASRVTFPVEARIGVMNRLTVGGRVTFVQPRVEATLRVFPSDAANLGINPAIDRSSVVQGFLNALTVAVASLPGDANGWGDFAEAFNAAYRSTGVFPVAGSPAALAIQARLAALDAELTQAGQPTLTATPVFADEVLDSDGLDQLLTSVLGPYRYFSLRDQIATWAAGDAEIWADYELFSDGDLNSVEGHGATVTLGARLPTGTVSNPNLLFDPGAGTAQLGLLFGGDGWVRRKKWGVAARVRGGVSMGTTIGLRLQNGGEALASAINFHTVDWTPGPTLDLTILPSLSPAPGLWADFGYRMAWQGESTIDRLSALPEGELTPVRPVGPMVTETDGLVARSGSTRHGIRIGLRLRPPSLDEGRVEVWSAWEATVAGSGADALRWSRLDLGARIWRTIW